MKMAFHQHQTSDHCALHALNNVLRENRYTDVDMMTADREGRDGNWSNTTIENRINADTVYACLSGPIVYSLNICQLALSPFFMGFIVVLPGHFVAMRRELRDDRVGYEWVDSMSEQVETLTLHEAMKRTEDGDKKDNLIAIFRRGEEFQALQKSITEKRKSRKRKL